MMPNLASSYDLGTSCLAREARAAVYATSGGSAAVGLLIDDGSLIDVLCIRRYSEGCEKILSNHAYLQVQNMS